MSDAGRKMDVEDVLSSIRRLVSEEARTVTNEIVADNVAKKTVETAVEVPEKLVLTPAFRVPETALPARAEEIFQAPVSAETPQEPETFFQPPQEDAPFAEVLDQETETQDAPFEAEVRGFTGQEVEDPEPESVTVPPKIMAESEPQAETIELVPELDSPKPEPDTSFHPEILHPITEETVPENEVAAESELQDNAPETATYGYDEVDYTSDSDTYLDEEALRELVSEMVRSELQGELGDRITRNVRKLVRREIHRALASRDFE